MIESLDLVFCAHGMKRRSFPDPQSVCLPQVHGTRGALHSHDPSKCSDNRPLVSEPPSSQRIPGVVLLHEAFCRIGAATRVRTRQKENLEASAATSQFHKSSRRISFSIENVVANSFSSLLPAHSLTHSRSQSTKEKLKNMDRMIYGKRDGPDLTLFRLVNVALDTL